MKFALFGNCQAGAMRWLLNESEEFRGNFSEIEISPSYLMSEGQVKEFIETVLPKLDYLFMQPHSDRMSPCHDSRFIAEKCENNSVKLLTFPQVYFNCYNPWEKNIDGISDQAFPDEIRYLDVFMGSYVLRGKGFKEFWESANSLSSERSSFFDSELNVCKQYFCDVERNRGCDVLVSDFILDEFRSRTLMHNINHPMPSVMYFIVNGILENLGFSTLFGEVDLFPVHNTLIYPCVAEHFRMGMSTDIYEAEARFSFYTKFFGDLKKDNDLLERFNVAVSENFTVL